MRLEPWYKVVTLREEVRRGRSFNPDEFAIALEQVVAGTAPEDYTDPERFFARTWFTRALREHTGMALRRLAGFTETTAPVLTLITQFGGGKTHTLTALYHLARIGAEAERYPGVRDVLKAAGLSTVPRAKVAVFVGNAWDPQEGKETPWLDVAVQLAGAAGREILGPAAGETAPGTEALGRVFRAAGAPVLVLFDEVLNFMNRHRAMADAFYAFLQNLTVAMTGTTHGVAVISLPRSQVEMTDWDLEWQEKITKVVRRVAKDLIANDESEIAEVVRRRLFDDLGSERVRRNVAKAYADWCFERRNQLPPEWTAVDTATTETKAREYLRGRFEACYPFHPATLSVFQRKWQALSQYQQTRGTLAMLAQWISRAALDGFRSARPEPLITLGSAPLEAPNFRAVVLGQLGESRLEAAIETDIAGAFSHARALDADTKGPLRDIHRRVATAIFFESSGGQRDKTAHLPELRFALGEPGIDTTTIDNAAFALEARAFFTRRVGSDGFQIHHEPTLRKVVSDRRASLDEEEVRAAVRSLVQEEFERGRALTPVYFPADGSEIGDIPRLTLVVADPAMEWTGGGPVRSQIADWTKRRGASERLYPAALVWCVKKPGRELREAVELWLAWRRVEQEVRAGTLGDVQERDQVPVKVKEAQEAARDEVWGGYRFAVIFDPEGPDGLKVIDLGAGHASAAESLSGRIVAALKAHGLLSESVGAGYIERHWPPALAASGAWPLAGLRQSFLNGTLTRLLDPDTVLRQKVIEFVQRGDFGLASGARPDGTYGRIWYREPVPPDEVAFESDVYLLMKQVVERVQSPPEPAAPFPAPVPEWPASPPAVEPAPQAGPVPAASEVLTGASGTVAGGGVRLRVAGSVPPEVWNKLGVRLIPKLRSETNLSVQVAFEVTADAARAAGLAAELRQILLDLGLAGQVSITEEPAEA